MNTKTERIKTDRKCIYFNKTTGLYDVKYNYSIYSISIGKNVHRSKWVYGMTDLESAEAALEQLKAGIADQESSTTLEDIYKLWLELAAAKQLSPVSIRNTKNSFNRICRFIPGGTPLVDITEDAYYRLIADCRNHGYSEETIRDVNATIRKLINLAERKKLISHNIFRYCDCVSIRKKDDHRVVEPCDMTEIDACLTSCYDLKYRVFFNLLYYTGLRVGEALALTFGDITDITYLSKDTSFHSHVITVSKSFDSGLRLVKDTKNYKNRSIPLTNKVYELLIPIIDMHNKNGGSPGDRIFSFNQSTTSYVLRMVCKAIGKPSFRCNDFRHTFVSNLIRASVPLPVIERVSGDTQATILSRYSHCFKDDEALILDVMSRL